MTEETTWQFPKKLLAKQPDKLYKYRSLSGENKGRALDIILNSRLYFTDPNMFNDIFDCKPDLIPDDDEVVKHFIGFCEENMGHRRIDANLVNKLLSVWHSEKLQGYYNQIVSLLGMHSFSESNDGMLLWSHYADSNSGICLEFSNFAENTAGFLPNYKYPLSLLPTGYSLTRPKLKLPPSDNADVAELYYMVLGKEKSWEYEEEWRACIFAFSCEDGRNITESRLHRFTESALTGVIVGANISIADEMDVVMCVAQRDARYGTDTALYKARPHETEYKIVVEPCEILYELKEVQKRHMVDRNAFPHRQ